MTKLSSSLSKAEASAERISEILDLVPEVSDSADVQSAPRFKGAVTFSGVTFGYRPGAPVLCNLTLAVQPGMTVALVGPTGSGKTSLLSLVARFYQADHGEVCIDGVDLRHYSIASVREQISLVLQEPILFAGTIRDNVAYGRIGASPEDVEEACRAVGLHDVVMRLPHGYETLVGERGGTLSGGQRQLVAIARALVRDTPIVLLDEPTTGLDTESEAMVMRGLNRLVEGRTTFVCTHQLHTIERADLILVLQHGQIREMGTHHELVRARGLYAYWLDVRASEQSNGVSRNSRYWPVLAGDANRQALPRRQ